jgi:hypothetical protein
MRIGVTGGSSAIGKTVIRKCRENGHEVVEFTRLITKSNQRYFDLVNDVFEIEVTDLDAMLHLAWDRKLEKQSGLHVSVNTSKRLIDKCKELKVNLVFLSSISANAESESIYGRSKYLVEEYATKHGFGVVRSGVIWGGQMSGFIETLFKISNLPLIKFLLLPDPVIQLTEEIALAGFLIENVIKDDRSQSQVVFVNGDMRLSQILDVMTNRKHRMQLGLPVSIAYRFARTLRTLGIPVPFDPDSLKSSTDAVTLQKSESNQLHGSLIPSYEFQNWIASVVSKK